MKKAVMVVLVLMMSAFLAAGAFADSLGDNITIPDRNGSSGQNAGGEDNEVEPGMVQGQGWDLEGFFLDESHILSLVGGYDFAAGFGDPSTSSGDVFIDIDGNAVYGDSDWLGGDGNHTVSNTFGYDYVFDLDFSTNTYNLISFVGYSDVQTTTALYRENGGSNPWQYVSGGETVGSGLSFSVTAAPVSSTDSRLAGTGISGWNGNDDHYVLTGLDLSFLAEGTEFTSHFTMSCGNDNLMGNGVVAPEPGTVFFVGAGIVGLLGWRRRRAGDDC